MQVTNEGIIAALKAANAEKDAIIASMLDDGFEKNAEICQLWQLIKILEEVQDAN
jgi:hypothetical protein